MAKYQTMVKWLKRLYKTIRIAVVKFNSTTVTTFVHYHKRSDVQHKKKIVNNVLGLGYQMNLGYLKSLHSCAGIHHVQNAIQMLEHPELDNSPELVTIETVKEKIQLHNFIQFVYNNDNNNNTNNNK